MKKIVLCLLVLSMVNFGVLLYGKDTIEIAWQQVIGGSDKERAISIAITPNGGYIVAGWTESNDGDVKGNHGKLDAWIVKLDSNGNIVWQKTLGGSNNDFATSIIPTPDGRYIVAGWTASNDGDVKENHGNADVWIVKLDGKGNMVWQKTFGGSGDEVASSIVPTPDGGYIIAGWTESNDGDVKGHHGYEDFWIVKIDSRGNIVWQKTLGGSHDDVATSIVTTPDGGYIVVGDTKSSDGDVKGHHERSDLWIVKLDDEGNIIWQKTLGGSGDDIATSVITTPNGGYIVVGWTDSFDGDVKENRGYEDVWIVELDGEGNLVRQKTFGGSGGDAAWAVAIAPDGGYIIAADTGSNDGDVVKNHGEVDLWVIKLDKEWNIEWQKVIGGKGWDTPSSIAVMSDGEYIIAGWTESNDGDVKGNHGKSDAWIVKLGGGENESRGTSLSEGNLWSYDL